MKELIEYIKNNKVSKKRLESEIRDERDQKLPQRSDFKQLKKYAEDFFTLGSQPRMIALSGLRGVGKTTLTWQTANYVYNKLHIKDIFFISIDDINRLNANLFDVIYSIESILGHPLNEHQEKMMLIFDEVHEAENWQKDLKILYERGKKIFVLATGSSALLLHSSSDLASRWTLIKIYPFDFTEFVLTKTWMLSPKKPLSPVKNLSKGLKGSFFYSPDYQKVKQTILSNQNKINSYFEEITKVTGQKIPLLIDEYISYHNIARFMPIFNQTLVIERVLSLFDRILLKDIPTSNTEHYLTYNRILLRLALSDEVNFQTLSKEFGIKENDIEQMITTLNHAEILNIFLPHGGIRKKTGKHKKIFFMSPSLRRALYSRIYGDRLSDDLRAKLYEDISAMYLKKNLGEGIVSYGYGKGKNPDFVIETMDSPVLMEIGINKRKSSQIKDYENYRYGFVINSKLNDIGFDDKNRIFFLPLKWFLLL